MPGKADKYSFRVEWSLEDESYVARCLEFPSLTAHGATHEEAISELKGVVHFGIRKLQKEGQPVPVPLGEKKYSGEFRLRVGEGLHRELAIDAAGEGLSLNTLVLTRLRGARSVVYGEPNHSKKSSEAPKKVVRKKAKKKA